MPVLLTVANSDADRRMAKVTLRMKRATVPREHGKIMSGSSGNPKVASLSATKKKRKNELFVLSLFS